MGGTVETTIARATVPRKALRPEEAAKSLGVSLDFFQEHIQPELKVIRRGRVRMIPVSELDRWLAENATAALRCEVGRLPQSAYRRNTVGHPFPAVSSGPERSNDQRAKVPLSA